jgi:hypothetical protein
MKNSIKKATEYISLIGRHSNVKKKVGIETNKACQNLRTKGFHVFDHLVGTKEFQELKVKVDIAIERDFNLEFPCLAHSKIDIKRDADLIKSNFFATNEALAERDLTFGLNDIKSYTQMLSEFQPSTLTMPMPADVSFYNLWLDPIIMSTVEAHMGFTPHMIEAYLRRNFPCTHAIMNHNWHRDTNHDEYLLKGFIFFTDCEIDTGAHHYISGSVNDPRFRDKTYYTDEEIEAVWPKDSKDYMTSKVPAGTIIIEDTRGLHKAGIPTRGLRDLGYAVFIPPNFFRRNKKYYDLPRAIFDKLNKKQKKFIPRPHIVKV